VDSLDGVDRPSELTRGEARALAVKGDLARAAIFRRHAMALGALWVIFGSMAFLVGGAELRFSGGQMIRDDLWRLAFAFFTAYGLGLAVTGICACRRSISAIYVGLGLTHIAAIMGFIAFNVSYIALSTALIYLAYRTIRLADDPGPEASSREGAPGALHSARSGHGESTLKRFMVAVIGLHLGSAIGGISGFLVGGLGMFLALIIRIVSDFYGLALFGGAFLGALSGAAGGALGGVVRGATLGISNARIKAMVLLGGTSAGIVAVGWLMINSAGFDWSRLKFWRDILFPILLSAISGAVGAVGGSWPTGFIARALSDRADDRAGDGRSIG
jgi:hypothetical protein